MQLVPCQPHYNGGHAIRHAHQDQSSYAGPKGTDFKAEAVLV
jgi:hypothetical protein